ncbi:replication/maintenance protein RepL [Arsenophonus nasoniae]|uniref:Replication/maintenance protein RepL n=1 Tax=Arsenophonus nasoniae TaxID=638 RepID=A0AA95GWG3_9GAMM|nr:replication/maintenance protein RepL [Arsenophonus nasoniae]WGM04114.1 replication/maintenance protein RepL [Arsenophonus nasoniae]
MGARILDVKTGEVLEEPEFVKLYIRDLCRVRGLTSTQYKIFNFMLANMNSDNIVSYGPRTKEKFLKVHNIKTQTYNNNVAKLIEAQLIARIGRNEFVVNKKYAVRVDWSRVQSIIWKSSYSKDGVSTEVDFNMKRD